MKLTSSHKYIKYTSTCWTVLTEYLLNAGGRPQTSERTRKSPHKHNRGEQKKVRKELGWDLHPREGAVKEERFLHPGKSPH